MTHGVTLKTSALLWTLALLNALWAPVNLMVVQSRTDLSVATIGLLRWSAFVVLLALFLRHQGFRNATGYRSPSRRDALGAMAVGALLFAPAHVAYYASLAKTTTLEANVLGTTFPIWTALLALAILGERVTRRRWMGIGLGFAGAYIIALGFRLPELRAESTQGNLLYLAGVISESLAAVLAARLIARSSGIGVLIYQVLGGVVTFALVPAVGLMPFEVEAPSLATVGAMAYLVLFPGLFCFAVWYMLIERAPLTLLVLSTLLQPPLAALLGWWRLGESIHLETAIGALLVFSALILAATERPRTAGPVTDALN